MESTFLSLVTNVILILGLAFVYGTLIPIFRRLPNYLSNVVFGLIFGVFAIFNMQYPIEVSPGVLIDMRNPLLIVAAVYGGWRGALAALIPIAVYRVIVGGAGAPAGVLSAISTGLIPVLYIAYFQKRPPFTMVTWVVINCITLAVLVIWITLTLSSDVGRVFLTTFIPPALILQPLTMWLLGHLLQRERDRVQLVDALAQSERRFKAIFNQTFQFIGLMKPDGVLVEINETALKFAGLEREQVIGKFIGATPWWADAEDVQVQLKESIKRAAEGEFVRYRVNIVGNEEKTTTIDFSLQPIFNDDGEVVLIIPEGRDVSDEIMAEKRRVELAIERERNELMRQFIEDSSHHLRTPITILQSTLYLFERTMDNAANIADKLKTLFAQQNVDLFNSNSQQLSMILTKNQSRMNTFQYGINNLNSLVDRLLDLVRLDRIGEIEFEPTNIKQLISAQSVPYQELATQQHLSIDFQLPENEVMVCGDTEWLQLVIQNLVENALRYTPEGGNVNVSLKQNEMTAELQVKDNGIGIITEDMDKIFSRFYRATNAQIMNSKGSGLGLAIVKKVIEAHQGTIKVDSELGRGTTFTISLPLSSQKQHNLFSLSSA